MKWLLKHEPVLIFGAVVAVGVFLVLHYGAVHALGIVQGLGTAVPVLVAGIARQFVTSPAGRQALTDAAGDVSRLPQIISDLEGVRNDVISLKDQIGPLPKTGGIISVTEALGKTVVEKRQEIAAIGEAIKADIEDLWNHKAQASFDPPKLTTGPTAGTAPTGGQVTIHEPETVPTVAEPVSEAPTPAADAVAELAALVP